MAQSKKYYDDDCLRSIEITIDSLLGEAIGKERYEQLYKNNSTILDNWITVVLM